MYNEIITKAQSAALALGLGVYLEKSTKIRVRSVQDLAQAVCGEVFLKFLVQCMHKNV
jgi:hypothetical protein